MASAPIYISRLPTAGLGELQPSQGMPGQITGQAAAQFGNAVGGLGQAALQAAATIEHVNRASTLADRQTKFLTDIDQVHQEFQNDQDPTTAPDRFSKRIEGIKGEALKGLGQEDSAELNLKLSRQVISYQGSVRDGALKKQADTYSAGLDKQYEVLTRRYAQAGSDAERQGIAAELDDTLNTGIKQGMTTAKGAEAYRTSLIKTGDSAVVYRQIATNPAAAQAALADPAQFAGLDPVQREQLTAQAKAAAEERQIAGVTNMAKFNPAQAAFMAGRITDPRQAEVIFDKAIIPQESGGQAGAVSKKGALGIGQVMPGTARMVAEKHGINDIVGLNDDELKARITSDPALGRRLGLLYFQDNLKQFNGNLAPTIAAYHAGGGGVVKKAHEDASAKYGETYSTEQFLEFLPASLTDGDKTTANYVRDIYKRMGAPTTGMGMSGMASFRAANSIGTVLDQQRAETDKILANQVAVAGRRSDEFSPLLEKGYMVDPTRISAMRAPLELAASRGDATAQQHLTRLNEAQQIAPVIREAYGMKPEVLEQATAQMRQQIALGGDETPIMAKRLKIFEAVQSEMSTARKDNPIALAERQGMPATPLNLDAQPNDPAFAQQIAARGVVSQRAQALYGGEHQFFRPEEKIAAKARFEAMAEDERFGMLRAISENAPNEAVYRAAVKDLTGGDKLAGTAGMFMRSNPGLAKDIFRGASIMQLDGVKAKAEEVKGALRSVLPGLMYPPEMQSQLIEAGTAIYAAERGKNATLYDATDRSGLEKAIERVIGKTANINGAKVPVPREISTWQVESLFGRGGLMTEKTLEASGGAVDSSGKPLSAEFIRRYATLVPADANVGDHARYRVVMRQGTTDKGIQTADGKGFLYINLKEAFRLESIQIQNDAVRQDNLFMRDKKTGRLLYPQDFGAGIIGGGGTP